MHQLFPRHCANHWKCIIIHETHLPLPSRVSLVEEAEIKQINTEKPNNNVVKFLNENKRQRTMVRVDPWSGVS